MIRDAEGQQVAHVWTLRRVGGRRRVAAGLRLAGEELVGFRSATWNDDGQDDLVWLHRRRGRAADVLRVALSDGTGYGEPTDLVRRATCSCRWPARSCSWATSMPTAAPTSPSWAGARRTAARSSWSLKKQPGRRLRCDRSRWWSGPQDIDSTVAAAWAGDLSGDGRADLIVRQHPDERRRPLQTAITSSPLPPATSAWAPSSWATSRRRSTRPRSSPSPGDANRDGREDVLMLIGRRAAGPASSGCRARPLGRASSACPLWTAPRTDRVPVGEDAAGRGRRRLRRHDRPGALQRHPTAPASAC